MKVTITFRHLEHTPSLDERIHEKSSKLSKYLGGKSQIKWSCYVKEGNHYAEVDLQGPNYNYHATGHSDSLYKTIDLVVAKIEKQIHKKKEKLTAKKSRKAHKDLEILEPEAAWTDYDENNFEDVA
ncbi:ribosome hibernation-promoting factor, HPF/YfiA family [Bacteriovorax sp. DB6_IX]|uniref:ribosome hibernation-promoting factor, HPF/YfiA family n=1 Tax=Bacteriovorax sp. DB6_IX TaxID=1353530 RepID=UPI00038A4032|nr:ribosome-associated translation inhibitor RaiA [Bacteriovorax sp. DB6_IX]EQC52431.1 ribosomal subunit interface protein [Bacteriovorax sp. DB6_IX]